MNTIQVTNNIITAQVEHNGVTVNISHSAPPIITTKVEGIQGPQGPQGPTGSSGAGYDHVQSTPSAVWVINHGLGFNPIVSAISTSKDEILGSVSHPTTDQTVITFSATVAGKARLT